MLPNRNILYTIDISKENLLVHNFKYTGQIIFTMFIFFGLSFRYLGACNSVEISVVINMINITLAKTVLNYDGRIISSTLL